jgi:hypothetical protein
MGPNDLDAMAAYFAPEPEAKQRYCDCEEYCQPGHDGICTVCGLPIDDSVRISRADYDTLLEAALLAVDLGLLDLQLEGYTIDTARAFRARCQELLEGRELKSQVAPCGAER